MIETYRIIANELVLNIITNYIKILNTELDENIEYTQTKESMLIKCTENIILKIKRKVLNIKNIKIENVWKILRID